ncbi:MAG: helix-turn-helix domain-containing protein [Lachnospiraceae bacterium]|nr:helix-turn-helix domain-containing protein [Lachnospiraceae bacterium]
MNKGQKFKTEIEDAISSYMPIKCIQSVKKDTVQLYCKKKYGMTYKECCFHRRISCIIDDFVYGKMDTEDLLKKYYGYEAEKSQLYRLFIQKAAPIYTIKKYFCEGDKFMASKEKQLEVLRFLTGRSSRVTCMEISKGTGLKEKTVRKCISDLREAKMTIVSKPGRHKSGYLMPDTKENKTYSECWINNVRVGRFNKEPDFKYA